MRASKYYAKIYMIMGLLTLFIAETFSQQIRAKRIKLSITTTPDYSYRTLSNNDGTAISSDIVAQRNSYEKAKLGMSSGLLFSYQFAQHFLFETGIQYSNKGYQTRKLSLQGLLPAPNLPFETKFIYTFNFVDVPLLIKISVGNNNLRFITGVGITGHYFMNEQQVTYLYYQSKTERTRENTNRDYTRFNFSPTFSMGLEYWINPTMQIRAEPIIRYNAFNINNEPVSAKLYSAGIQLGYGVVF